MRIEFWQNFHPKSLICNLSKIANKHRTKQSVSAEENLLILLLVHVHTQVGRWLCSGELKNVNACIRPT